MNTNPVLKKLGFSDTDRIAIIHTDDIGMCQATVTAYDELVQYGLISSAAVMAPCAWFPLAAQYCRDHADQVDMGVHLTLNAEYEYYRWGPLSTRDPQTGLMDADGYLHSLSEPTQQHADQAAVHRELETQVEMVLRSGIQATHVDTHMGTVAHPKFMGSYLQMGMQYRLPMMMLRFNASQWMQMGLDAEGAAAAEQMVSMLEEQGIPLLDNISMMPLDTPENRLQRTMKALDDLPAGITHFIIHPAADGAEIRGIAPDWACRVADHQTWKMDELRAHIKNCGIHVIGYRQLKELM